MADVKPKTELDNSKRRFYKATYQIALPDNSSKDNSASRAPSLMRGVEKTNFIHTLSVTQAELDQLGGAVIAHAKPGTVCESGACTVLLGAAIGVRGRARHDVAS